MTLLTGLTLAALLAGTQAIDPTGRANLAPPTVEAPDDVADAASGDDAREDIALRRNPNEVTCQTRPVTGSRFTRRVCQTRLQAGIAHAEAQRVLTDARPGPTTDAILDGPNFGPQ